MSLGRINSENEGSYIDNLELFWAPLVTLGLAVSLILIGLRKEFDGFVQNYNMHSLGKTVNELTLEEELSSYLAELLKKKKNAASGAGGSVSKASRKLKPRALSLYVGNGQREAVEAIGNFDLSLPSGLVIVLNNYGKETLHTSKWKGAIDILGLIHNRWYVPILRVMSRQGASTSSVSLRLPALGLMFTLLKHKQMFETFKVFQKEVENQLGKTIKSLRSDRGGEYMSQEFLDHLKDHGIIAHRTPPYTPQHNGVSERRNRTLLDMVRSMMSQTTLPKSFWDYALETAARILNMVPTKKVEKTPYEVWHGQAPKLSYLKVWGCEALVKRDTITKPDKLEPRSIKCIFVGYPKETMGYSFYYPPENKVLVARNVEFLENKEDTHPSIDTSLNHEEDDLEIDEPQSDIIPIRRSTRTRHAPDRMCLYIDAEEHELGDLGEPANYKAALLDPESDKWLNAMNVEMQSMKDNEVWDLVELPPNDKTVGSKWFFKKKAILKPHGLIMRKPSLLLQTFELLGFL
ncbi:retrotransposon protein, putative, ty1-copia subclass [Tanacetum coccineum]